MKDRLTRRERLLYKGLHGLGLVWAAAGFLCFFVLKWHEPSYASAALFAIACLPVPIFSYALRTDTRVIHGSRWLRQE